MSESRETILTAIRRGLAVPATAPPTPDPPLSEWFPVLAKSELVSVFSTALQILQGEVFEEPDEAATGRRVAELIEGNAADRVWVQPGLPFPRVCDTVDDVSTIADFKGHEEAKRRLENAQVSITDAICFVARHGTILIGTTTQGGRMLSFLPEHHIVVGRKTQLVPDLADAIAIARDRFGDNWPSFLSLITGSSRTADIEKILVLGAHGPRRLSVILY